MPGTLEEEEKAVLIGVTKRREEDVKSRIKRELRVLKGLYLTIRAVALIP